MGNIRDALIGHGAVIDVIDRALKLLEAVIGAGAAGEQHMLRILDPDLLGPSGGLLTAIFRTIGALRKQKQPHRVEILSAIGGCVGCPEFAEAMGEPGLVGGHFARHEDETVEHHARPNDWDILE